MKLKILSITSILLLAISAYAEMDSASIRPVQYTTNEHSESKGDGEAYHADEHSESESGSESGSESESESSGGGESYHLLTRSDRKAFDRCYPSYRRGGRIEKYCPDTSIARGVEIYKGYMWNTEGDPTYTSKLWIPPKIVKKYSAISLNTVTHNGQTEECYVSYTKYYASQSVPDPMKFTGEYKHDHQGDGRDTGSGGIRNTTYLVALPEGTKHIRAQGEVESCNPWIYVYVRGGLRR